MPVPDFREAVMADTSAATVVVRSYPFGPNVGLVTHPMHFWLQEHEALARVKLPYGEEGWLLTRYDDVRTALADPRFSLAQAAVRDVPRLTPQRQGAILTDLDPPGHTRLRRLVAKAFTVRRGGGVRPPARPTNQQPPAPTGEGGGPGAPGGGGAGPPPPPAIFEV